MHWSWITRLSVLGLVLQMREYWTCSEPQGSVLGPLLFILCTDLGNVVVSECRLFQQSTHSAYFERFNFRLMGYTSLLSNSNSWYCRVVVLFLVPESWTSYLWSWKSKPRIYVVAFCDLNEELQQQNSNSATENGPTLSSSASENKWLLSSRMWS